MQRTEKQDVYPDYQPDRQSLGKRCQALGETVERRTCSRTDYAATPPQREALQRNQRSLSVGKRHGSKLRGSHLDDVQKGIGA